MSELPRVRVVNQNDGWLGTECYIDGKKIDKVKRIDFSVGSDEVPTFVFETMGIPDIDMSGRVIFDFKPENVMESAKILQNELLKHEELYDGFVSSIESSLKNYGYSGLPFESDNDMAKKILNYVIGEECE